MNEDVTVDGAQEAPTDEAPVAEEPTIETANDDTPEVAEEAESNEQLVPLSELKKVRSEAASLRQRLRHSENRVTTLETERDTAVQERERLQDQLYTHELERAVLDAAGDPKLGARNPAKLLKLIDRANIQSENGTLSGVEVELQRLRSEWPELFVTGGADGGKLTQPAQNTAPGFDRLVNAYASTSGRR